MKKDAGVVVCRNPRHKGCKPVKIGRGQSTKVNANIGTSQGFNSLDKELKKLDVCVKAKADAVMDLSTAGDLDRIRAAIIKNSPLIVGTVPIYQAMVEAGSVKDLTAEHIFEAVEKHASGGVDFVTVHCGVNRRISEIVKKKKRVTGIVSRGGAFLFAWMQYHKKENPLFEQYDRLLYILKKYNVVLSLGDGLRPGSIHDSGDAAQIGELKVLGSLAERARQKGVQVIIEGPGHVPINQIVEQMKMEKKICGGAPFYVLGPLPTDIAAGYDHITSAIGGALAAAAGADFLCYVTPAEHLGLPTVEDVREGIIVSRIAAHIGDIAKRVPGTADRDMEMSKARKELNWKKQMMLSIDPEKFRKMYASRSPHNRKKVCTMCGKYCAMDVMDRAVRG